MDAYIGARMRESRLALNMTQESLGELLGVTFQQIQSMRAAETVSARLACSRSARPSRSIAGVDVRARAEEQHRNQRLGAFGNFAASKGTGR